MSELYLSGFNQSLEINNFDKYFNGKVYINQKYYNIIKRIKRFLLNIFIRDYFINDIKINNYLHYLFNN